MLIEDMVKEWLLDELKAQQVKLKNLENATHFEKIKNYGIVLEMRREIVKTCKKYEKKLKS